MIVSKQFEVLNEAVPTATVIGCLLNPDNPNSEINERGPGATRRLHRELEVLHARRILESIILVIAITGRDASLCDEGRSPNGCSATRCAIGLTHSERI
jgi:hypothetical protein